MYQPILIEKVQPNPWNPNKMTPDFAVKLEEGIKMVMEKAGKIPPITVRPYPNWKVDLKGYKGAFQIIDGEHRWTILKKLKLETVDAFVLPVDDATARILTATLNYIKGEADPNKYPVMVAEIIQKNPDITLDELTKFLPQTSDMLWEMIESNVEASTILADAMEGREEVPAELDPERWVTLSFSVPLEVAQIVEKELDRIAGHLTGKNRRTRALEYVAINSALTPMESVQSEITKKEPKPKPKDVEKELEKVASKKPKVAPKKKAVA